MARLVFKLFLNGQNAPAVLAWMLGLGAAVALLTWTVRATRAGLAAREAKRRRDNLAFARALGVIS